MFPLGTVQGNAQKALMDVWWFLFEGKAFGDQSNCPLKVRLSTGAEDWSKKWTDGSSEYARRLPPGERKRFVQSAQAAITTDSAAITYASRYAIRETGIIKGVSPVFPLVQDVEKELLLADQKVFGWKTLPAELAALYRQRSDGRWGLPIQVAPPEIYLATPDAINKLLAFEDFISQVAAHRMTLSQERVEIEEEELENLALGSKPSALGAT